MALGAVTASLAGMSSILCPEPYGHVQQWLGVPYAQPPTGGLRFRPPIPYTGQYPLNASTQRPLCTQWDGSGEGDEDCLYLDIYAPIYNGTLPKLPVRVWIHGGSFKFGGTPAGWGCGSVDHSGEVIVAIRYRMGAFGFLAHPDTITESGTTGNWGLLDQQMALEWVKRNIETFGGDSNRVMIYGNSAGGMSVYTHMVVPTSIGLFHSAMAISGTEYPLNTLDKGYATTQGLVDALGCQGSNVMACLRAKDAKEFWQAVVFPYYDPYIMTGEEKDFLPTVDGKFLPDHPDKLFAKGKTAQKVSFYTGTTRLESRSFFNASLFNVPQDVNDYFLKTVPEEFVANVTKQYYPEASTDKDVIFDAVTNSWTDAFMLCPAQRTLRALSSQGLAAYSYFFNLSLSCAPELGPRHTYDVPMLQGATSESLDYTVPCNFTEPELQLSKIMMDGIRGLSTQGKPFPHLDAWTAQAPTTAVFDDTGATFVEWHVEDRCRVWDAIHDAVHGPF